MHTLNLYVCGVRVAALEALFRRHYDKAQRNRDARALRAAATELQRTARGYLYGLVPARAARRRRAAMSRFRSFRSSTADFPRGWGRHLPARPNDMARSVSVPCARGQPRFIIGDGGRRTREPAFKSSGRVLNPFTFGLFNGTAANFKIETVTVWCGDHLHRNRHV